jgi:hypothetical protein
MVTTITFNASNDSWVALTKGAHLTNARDALPLVVVTSTVDPFVAGKFFSARNF